jgi:hypothetical protein
MCEDIGAVENTVRTCNLNLRGAVVAEEPEGKRTKKRHFAP